MIAMIFIAIAVQYVGRGHGNFFGSILHLIGDALDKIEVSCASQVDIETPAWTMMDSKNGYELWKYLEDKVNFGFWFWFFSFYNLFVKLSMCFLFFYCIFKVFLCTHFVCTETLQLTQKFCKLEFGF